MQILAFIPARAGSKRIESKNMRLLAGAPLIDWTITAALDSKCFDNIFISTDCSKIASHVKNSFNLDVPWLRPASLSDDHAVTIDAIMHTLNEFEKKKIIFDAVMLLQPTSPFRKVASISNAINCFKKFDGKRSIVSFTKIDEHPEWFFSESHNAIKPILGWDKLVTRSQDFPQYFTLNGLIYISSVAELKLRNTFLSSSTIPLFIEKGMQTIDIDTEADWVNAETQLSFTKKELYHD